MTEKMSQAYCDEYIVKANSNNQEFIRIRRVIRIDVIY